MRKPCIEQEQLSVGHLFMETEINNCIIHYMENFESETDYDNQFIKNISHF